MRRTWLLEGQGASINRWQDWSFNGKIFRSFDLAAALIKAISRCTHLLCVCLCVCPHASSSPVKSRPSSPAYQPPTKQENLSAPQVAKVILFATLVWLSFYIWSESKHFGLDMVCVCVDAPASLLVRVYTWDIKIFGGVWCVRACAVWIQLIRSHPAPRSAAFTVRLGLPNKVK